jgi:hypothetical protein
MAVPDVAMVGQKGPEIRGYTTGYTVARRCPWTLGDDRRRIDPIISLYFIDPTKAIRRPWTAESLLDIQVQNVE